MDSTTPNLMGEMESPSQSSSQRTGWFQTLAGILPFLILVPATLVYMLDREGGFFIFLLTYLVLLVGLGVGWVKAFPHWSYPYAGLVLALTFLLVSQHDSEESLLVNLVFSLLFSLPFLLLVLVAMLVSHSERSLGKLAKGIWSDWTLLSFLFYGTAPLVLMVAFVQIAFSSGFLFLGCATIALLAGAWVYLKVTNLWWRLVSLLFGLTTAWGISTLGIILYWNDGMESWVGTPGDAGTILQGSLIAWGIFMGLLLAPWLLSKLPGLRHADPTSS